jgi:hypothetical protein
VFGKREKINLKSEKDKIKIMAAFATLGGAESEDRKKQLYICRGCGVEHGGFSTTNFFIKSKDGQPIYQLPHPCPACEKKEQEEWIRTHTQERYGVIPEIGSIKILQHPEATPGDWNRVALFAYSRKTGGYIYAEFDGNRDFVDDYNQHLTKEYVLILFDGAKERGFTKELDPETWGQSYGTRITEGFLDETPRKSEWRDANGNIISTRSQGYSGAWYILSGMVLIVGLLWYWKGHNSTSL